MKQSLIILVFFAQSGYSQNTPSQLQRAIEFQQLSWKASLVSDYEKSIRYADSSILLDSSRSEPLILKAEALTLLKRYRESAETYLKWMSLDTTILVIGAHVHLGMLYDMAGMFEKAKTNYLKAIKLYESGQYFQPKSLGPVEDWEYVMAFGLLGNMEMWKEKLAAFKQKHPGFDITMFMMMDRDNLLEHHFRLYKDG